MIRTKTTYGLIVLLLLLIGCSPQPPTSEEAPSESAAEPTTSALSRVEDEDDAEEEDVVAETAAERPTPTVVITVEEEYPAPPTPAVNIDSYPPQAEIDARQAAGGYPAENMEMVDELTEADADVLFVTATEAADGSWTFEVTVEHPDTGWEDYADGWDVITTQGEVLKVDANDPFTRLLLHPHETEQPFTRSQSGLVLPRDVNDVFVRAHDIVHGWGGEIVYVNLNTADGPNYEVIRNGE